MVQTKHRWLLIAPSDWLIDWLHKLTALIWCDMKTARTQHHQSENNYHYRDVIRPTVAAAALDTGGFRTQLAPLPSPPSPPFGRSRERPVKARTITSPFVTAPSRQTRRHRWIQPLVLNKSSCADWINGGVSPRLCAPHEFNDVVFIW